MIIGEKLPSNAAEILDSEQSPTNRDILTHFSKEIGKMSKQECTKIVIKCRTDLVTYLLQLRQIWEKCGLNDPSFTCHPKFAMILLIWTEYGR